MYDIARIKTMSDDEFHQLITHLKILAYDIDHIKRDRQNQFPTNVKATARRSVFDDTYWFIEQLAMVRELTEEQRQE